MDANGSDEDYIHNCYALTPYVGIRQRTVQSARLEGDVLQAQFHLDGKDSGGDGTVPRISATPLELSYERKETFLGTRHSSLQYAEALMLQLEGLVRDDGLDLRSFNSAVTASTAAFIRLDCEDVYLDGTAVRIRAKGSAQGRQLSFKVVDLATDEVTFDEFLDGDTNGAREVQLRLASGRAYRVRVASADGLTAAEDVFYVA